MGFVTRHSELGFTVVENRGSEAQLQRALKQVDDRLVLQWHPGDVEGGFVYKVLKVVSEDEPAEYVTTWADEYGRPLPLSFGLVDRVKSQVLGSRNQGIDADEYNRRLSEQREKDRLAALEKISEEHRPKVERGQLTVSMGAGTSKRSWQRNLEPPKGAAA